MQDSKNKTLGNGKSKLMIKHRIIFKEMSYCTFTKSVFRVNHSTDPCLSQSTDMILNGTGNGKQWYNFK